MAELGLAECGVVLSTPFFGVGRFLALIILRCLFVSKRTPNKSVMLQATIVIIVLGYSTFDHSNPVLQRHSIVWRLETNKHQPLTSVRRPCPCCQSLLRNRKFSALFDR